MAIPNNDDSRRSETVAIHRRAVERVIRAMSSRLYEGMTLQAMADVAIMSPYHFSRTFREVTGITPSHFLCGLRFEAAKLSLLESSANVTEICFDVGYNSLGTFTRRFKELVTLPPRDFRLLARNAKGAPLETLKRRTNDFRPVAAQRQGVTGQVWAPTTLSGPIFIGLFPKPIPEGRPISCTVLPAAGGKYRLKPAPPGQYYLFSVGLSWSASPKRSLILDSAHRAGVLGAPLLVTRDGWVGETDLLLRPPERIDPPIPMALAFLLGEELSRRKTRARAVPGGLLHAPARLGASETRSEISNPLSPDSSQH